MLKVLQIASEDIKGGIFKVISDIDSAFTGDNDINVFTAAGESSINLRSKIHNCYLFSDNPLIRFLSYFRIPKKFDIIHFHGFNLFFFIFLFFSNTGIMYTNHGLLGTGRKLRKYEYLKKWILIFFLRKRVDLIVNVSEYAQKRITEEYKISVSKNTVVYNTSRCIKQDNKGMNRDEIILGFHGRFVSFKRVDRIFKVAMNLREISGLSPIIVLIGEGPLINFYENLAENNSIELKIIPYTDNPESEIRKLDILIIPSDEEYFGISVLEGILSGVMTFVFRDGGGCTEIFGNIHKWFVCENELDMALKIKYTMENINDVINRFESLQSYVASVFSRDNFLSGYKESFLNVMKKKK
jgi:glycosyltransferase involved in cell wall biosynthesis